MLLAVVEPFVPCKPLIGVGVSVVSREALLAGLNDYYFF